jgi:hypothetical protein
MFLGRHFVETALFLRHGAESGWDGWDRQWRDNGAEGRVLERGVGSSGDCGGSAGSGAEDRVGATSF